MKQDVNHPYRWYHRRAQACLQEDVKHCQHLMEHRDGFYQVDDLVTLSNQIGISIEDMLHRK